MGGQTRIATGSLVVALLGCAIDDRSLTAETGGANGDAASPLADAAGGADASGGHGGSGGAGGAYHGGAAGDGHMDAGDGAHIEPITVSGRVIDGNAPIARAAVLIGAYSAVTATDGTFTIRNVVPPYDAAVVLDKSLAQINEGALFVGLTRADPTLQFYESDVPPDKGTVSGRLSGGAAFPLAAEATAQIVFDGPQSSAMWRMTTGPAYGPVEIDWFGASMVSGTLHALQWLTDGAGIPVEYQGYGFVPLEVADNDALMDKDIALGSIGHAELSGSAVVPAGYSLFAKRVFAHVDSMGRAASTFQVVDDESPTATFSYHTPVIGAATADAVVIAVQGKRSSAAYLAGLAPNATGVTLTAPEAPAPSLPVDTATNVDHATEFAWSPFTGGVHLVRIYADGILFNLVTTDNHVHIPDLDRAGLSLPKGTTFTWDIFAWGPYASVDEAAGPRGFGVRVGGDHAPGVNGFSGYSEQRTFVTAP
jgi:hypothetical protein